MLKLERLRTYEKQIRRNARTGASEIEALDVNRKNRIKDIPIPPNGYILKPNEVYIAQVSNPSSPAYIEKNFVKELTSLGVTCKIVEDECFITVQRPLRIYEDMNLFYEDERNTDQH